jgi:hypothetical protein
MAFDSEIVPALSIQPRPESNKQVNVIVDVVQNETEVSLSIHLVTSHADGSFRSLETRFGNTITVFQRIGELRSSWLHNRLLYRSSIERHTNCHSTLFSSIPAASCTAIGKITLIKMSDATLKLFDELLACVIKSSFAMEDTANSLASDPQHAARVALLKDALDSTKVLLTKVLIHPALTIDIVTHIFRRKDKRFDPCWDDRGSDAVALFSPSSKFHLRACNYPRYESRYSWRDPDLSPPLDKGSFMGEYGVSCLETCCRKSHSFSC